MHVVRIADAPGYEAPGHHLMQMQRLQGREAGPTDTVWLGVSAIAPGGGTALDASGVEKIYVVLEGEIVLSNGLEEVRLNALDSCRLAPGEARQLRNEGGAAPHAPTGGHPMADTAASPRPRKPWYQVLYIQVLIGIALAIVTGYFWPAVAVDMKPLGDVFIKLIKMIVALVIFCTVVTGIAGMSDLKKVGRVGGKALLYFEVMSTIALAIGIIVANVVRPGAGFNANPDIIAFTGISDAAFAAARDRQLAEIERRRACYLGTRPRPDLSGRTVIVVDDGIATGATTRAALRAVRAGHPARIVLAVPVAPTDVLRQLAGEADEIVCLEDHVDFGAVGYFYRDFREVSDEEVIALLARHPPPSSSQAG